MLYAEIVVDISIGNLDKTYQYVIPEELENQISAGSLVEVPFGRGNRRIKGYVVSITDKAAYAADLMKKISRIDEKDLAIETQLISLAIWMKENYGGTLNEALRTVIPVKRKVKETGRQKLLLNCNLADAEATLKEALRKKNLNARAALLSELLLKKEMDYDAVKKMNISDTVINTLVKKGVIRIEMQQVYRNPIKAEGYEGSRKQLNPEQQQIVDGILMDYRRGFKKNYLIHGVTGSGKTEVYLEIIKGIIKNRQQVIMLIPEIALTFQTVKRFYERFGERVSILHSRMSQGERYDQIKRAEKGEIDVMIGPRSALFTPFQNLGLIIIDEEHESSYKSEMPPKYHTRETAVERAAKAGAFVVLGSATPSLEAYQDALHGRYTLLQLKHRALDAGFPEVEIIDLRKELKNGNKTIYSVKLIASMRDRLDKKEQIMLFINRRGYAGFVSCRSCGKAVKCPHCDISLTLHNNQRLICHYCGYSIDMPKLCPSCDSRYIAAFGTGTQKVEEQIKTIFPDAAVLRMDADTTKKKNSHEKILSEFAGQEADILIGTQMIVKGHDFPNVTLVGILAADLSLFTGDYRASERTFQLLAQASGRSGRGGKAGRVLIQTYQPEHYSILAAAAEDYSRFFEQEILYRNVMQYPPASHILAVLLMSNDEGRLTTAAERVKTAANAFILQQKEAKATLLVGPAPCNVSKISDVYRKVLYIKQPEYQKLVQIKNHLDKLLISEKLAPGCLVQFDFDPVNGY